MTKGLSIAAALLGSICLTGICRADTATFNYVKTGVGGNSNTSAGTSATFQSVENAAYTVTAYGFDSGSTSIIPKPVNMYYKNAGVNELGLGIANPNDLGGDNEIDKKHFVQLDLQNLQSKGFGFFTFFIGSGQLNEGYQIFGSNSLGDIGSSVFKDLNPTGKTALNGLSYTADLSKPYRYYSVQDAGSNDNGNIVLENGSSASKVTPEGQSLGLLAGGLIPLGFLLRRRKTKVA